MEHQIEELSISVRERGELLAALVPVTGGEEWARRLEEDSGAISTVISVSFQQQTKNYDTVVYYCEERYVNTKLLKSMVCQ